MKSSSKDTLEPYVMGVKKEYHHKGIDTLFFQQAKEYAKKQGYSFIQVKTVQMGKYGERDKTNLFYISFGFKELEVFPTLWDEWNPWQIYIMNI